MIVPRTTYRLQLRNGMTFETAARCVPYFARLGISHLYLSPIFEATPGSTHGYDVVDCSRLDPALGGEAGFARLCEEAERHGLGLIVDFVPNHMAATPHNPWWRDVLEWGRDGAYAQHFDIDWSAPTLIVPVLAKAYGELLAEGAFGLDLERRSGELRVTYGDLKLPVTPPSYGMFLERIAGDTFKELAGRFAAAKREDTAALKAELARLAADPGTWSALEQETRALAADRDALDALHERQVWRLSHWRAAREALTWRRFFEISDLVGLKVERDDVFGDVHARLLELVDAGKIAGIRLDHIDGLADPKGYLERLQAALGRRAPFYLVIEKILGPGEDVRSELARRRHHRLRVRQGGYGPADRYGRRDGHDGCLPGLPRRGRRLRRPRPRCQAAHLEAQSDRRTDWSRRHGTRARSADAWRALPWSRYAEAGDRGAGCGA